jgi:hypothetical protein
MLLRELIGIYCANHTGYILRVGKLSVILYDTAFGTYSYRCAKNGQAKCIPASGTVPAAQVYDWIKKFSSCYQRTAMMSSAHFKTPERCICYTVLLLCP